MTAKFRTDKAIREGQRELTRCRASNYWPTFWYAYGWERCQHCDCEGCVKQRQERGLERCNEGSCQGCLNKGMGKKVRDWRKDFVDERKSGV